MQDKNVLLKQWAIKINKYIEISKLTFDKNELKPEKISLDSKPNTSFLWIWFLNEDKNKTDARNVN